MPAFLAMDGKEQTVVRDYLSQRALQEENLAYTREGRAFQREQRAALAEQRAAASVERKAWSDYFQLSDPQVIREIGRAGILRELPNIGPQHVARLLNDHEQIARGDAAVRAATVDRDMLKDVLFNAGIDYVYQTPSELSEAQRATLGRAFATIEEAVSRAQHGGTALTYEQKRTLAEQVIDQKVRLSDWFWDSELPAALVNPEDRSTVYLPMTHIINRESRKLTDAVNYLRGLPGNTTKTDDELRRLYRSRIEKAVGRSLTGGTYQEIERALKGLD
jgi:hypothetical protein